MKKHRNWLLFMIVVLIWGSNWSAMKTGLQVVGPLNFVMQRFLFASLALAPLQLHFRKEIPKDRSSWTKLLLLSTINALSILSTNIGLVHEKSGISAVLTYTQPLFVFLLALLFLGEELGPSRILGTLVGFFGVTVLYFGRIVAFSTLSYPLLFLLLGAFFWAVTIVYYKKTLSHVSPILTNIVQLTVGASFLSILALTFEGFAFSIEASYLFIVFYMSVGASALALTLWMFLLKEEEAIVLSSSSFIIPMVALVFGWLVLRETVEPLALVGFALILTGVYLVNKKAGGRSPRLA